VKVLKNPKVDFDKVISSNVLFCYEVTKGPSPSIKFTGDPSYDYLPSGHGILYPSGKCATDTIEKFLV